MFTFDEIFSLMYRSIYLLLLIVLLPILSVSQILIGFNSPDSSAAKSDTPKSTSVPDATQTDIPFIDYKLAVIWNTPTDSVCDYAYIRRNFTDQLISIWSNPRRLYPASRIYAVDMDGKHYRAVRVSAQNYVFAEKIVDGEMDLYLYQIIPQLNGWVEFVGKDFTGQVYHNNMIYDNRVTKGKQQKYGYFFTIGNDSLKPLSASSLQKFSDAYLFSTPAAKAIAEKFTCKNQNTSRKAAVIGLMTVGFVGLALTGEGGASLIFLAGFPAAAAVAFLNRPHTLHWEDMVEIVSTYNREISVGSMNKRME